MFLLFVNHCCLERLRVIHLRILRPLFFISASDDNNSEVVEVVDSSTLEEISFDEERGGSYLTLEEVAVFVSHLASNGNYLLLTLIREGSMAKWLARRHPGVGSPKSRTNGFFSRKRRV